ncbi:MAG: response regulator [Desulforhopalus sp.]|nr:response regulator [Desulforhopalus sp.]
MEPKKILIVEDAPTTRDYLAQLIEIMGFQPHALQRKTDLLDDMCHQNPDLVLLGSCNDTEEVKDFVKIVRENKNGIPILVIRDGKDTPRERVNHSSANFATIPSTFKPKELKLTIKRLTNGRQNSRYQEVKDIIIGESPAMLRVKEHVLRLSKSDVTILITGESGTGKELVARAIHLLSSRADNPFIKVNSAALPTNLLESELFGFEKGAFTGAWQQKPGKFKLAHRGSLLLDEIGEVPLPMQAKLLQVLEDNELSALGSTTTTKIDVRVFAVTNASLTRMVSEGSFRSDLYYRLNVVRIHLPPMRERKEDIRALTDHLLEKYATRYGRERATLKETTLGLFHQYSWPGNIRELENIIQSIIVLRNEETFWEKLKNQSPSTAEQGRVGYGPTASSSTAFTSSSSGRCSLKELCKEAARKAETSAILDALCHTRWNRRKTAELLRISYKALLNKINEYKIKEEYRSMIGKDTVFNDHAQGTLP